MFGLFKVNYISLVVLVTMLLIHLREIIKPDPTLAVLDAFQFLADLFFGVASSFHDFPESKELCFFDSSILVNINLVEKFCC